MKRNLILLVTLILSLQFQTAFADINSPSEHINKMEKDCNEDWYCFTCTRKGSGEEIKRKYTQIKDIDIDDWAKIYKKSDYDFDREKFLNYTKSCISNEYVDKTTGMPITSFPLLWESCSIDNPKNSRKFEFPKNLDTNKCNKIKNKENSEDIDLDEYDPGFATSMFEGDAKFDQMSIKVGFNKEENSYLQLAIKFRADFNDITDSKIISEYDSYISKHKKYVTYLNTLILFYEAVSKKCDLPEKELFDFGYVEIDKKEYGRKKISKSFIIDCQTGFYSFQYQPIFKKHKIIFEESADYVDIRDNGKSTLEEKLSNAKNNVTRTDKKRKDREAKRREKEKEAEAAADKLAEENRIAAEAEKKAKAAQRQRDEAKRIADEAAADKLAEEDRIAAEADKKEQARIAANKKKAAFWDTIWSLITSTLLIVIAATVGFMFGSRNNKKVSNADVVSNEQQRELVIKIKTLEEKNQSLERLIEKSLSRQEPQILTKVDIPNEVVKELSEAEKQAEVDRSRQSSYWDAIDNPNLIEKFTAAYNVIGLDKVGRVKKGENALLQVDQKSIEKSNFWAVPHKDVWVILPGRTLSINAAALTADDGRYGRELFAGIFKLEFGSQFEVTASKTLARKTAEGFLVFQQGTVMLPK